jgi:hypothetical protein
MPGLIPILPRRQPKPLPVLEDKPQGLEDLVTAPPTPRPHAPVLVEPLPIARTTNATQPNSVRSAQGSTRKRSEIVTLVLEPGQTFPMAAFGNRFQLLSSPIPIPIRYDETAGFSTYSPGLGIMVVTESEFRQLEFQNPLTENAITVQVFFGWDEQAAYITPCFPAQVAEGLGGIVTSNVAQLVALGTEFQGQSFTFRRGFFLRLEGNSSQ